MIILSHRPSLNKLKIFGNVSDAAVFHSTLQGNRDIPAADLVFYELDNEAHLLNYTEFTLTDTQLTIQKIAQRVIHSAGPQNWRIAHEQRKLVGQDKIDAEWNIANEGEEGYVERPIPNKIATTYSCIDEVIEEQILAVKKLII